MVKNPRGTPRGINLNIKSTGDLEQQICIEFFLFFSISYYSNENNIVLQNFWLWLTAGAFLFRLQVYLTSVITSSEVIKVKIPAAPQHTIARCFEPIHRSTIIIGVNIVIESYDTIKYRTYSNTKPQKE